MRIAQPPLSSKHNVWRAQSQLGIRYTPLRSLEPGQENPTFAQGEGPCSCQFHHSKTLSFEKFDRYWQLFLELCPAPICSPANLVGHTAQRRLSDTGSARGGCSKSILRKRAGDDTQEPSYAPNWNVITRFWEVVESDPRPYTGFGVFQRECIVHPFNTSRCNLMLQQTPPSQGRLSRSLTWQQPALIAPWIFNSIRLWLHPTEVSILVLG